MKQNFYERLAGWLAVLSIALALVAVLTGCAPQVAQAAPAPTPTATTTPTTAPTPTATVTPGACTVTGTAGDWLYIRQTPGGAIIGALRPGQRVTVLTDAGDWWQVQAGDLAGFVFKMFCR